MSNIIPPSGRCAFVVNMPMRVDSDSETPDSSEEELDGNFAEECFEEPLEHFRLRPGNKNNNLRGTLLDATPQKNSTQNPKNIEKVREIYRKFEKEDKKLKGKLLSRTKIVLGPNKMQSLSRSRNRSLQAHLDEQDPSIPVEKVPFFWDGRWQKKRGSQWVESSYEHTRKFYKQLKSRDVTKAREFRKNIEEKKRHLIPHREIHDRIKNDPKTRRATRKLRRDTGKDVFLLFLDGDTQSLRSEHSSGPFSVIDQHAAEASIISTGYTIEESGNAALEIGVKADLVVRNATAKYFPHGVYFPEPCTAIKIRENEETVIQDFSDGSLNYPSPNEMPILINKVLRARNLNPFSSMKFDSEGSIVTETPERMSERGKFNCTANSEGHLLSFGIHDIRRMRNVSQTHYDPLHWAKNLLPALNIKKSIELFGVELDNSLHIEQLTIGILARVFKLYDPIEKALEISKREKLNFVEALNYILNRWHSPCENVPPPGRKKFDCGTVVRSLLTQIGSSQKKLRVALGSVLEKTTRSRRVFDAAKDSGKAVWELFANNLWHNSIEKMMLINLKNLSKYELPEELESLYEGSLLQKILRKEAFDKADYQSYKGSAVTPLHIAAFSGNTVSVKQIIFYGGSLQRKDYQDRAPFVYGLMYCEMNGIDVDLLLALLDEKSSIEELGKFIDKFMPVLEEEIEESDAPIEKCNELLAKLRMGCLATSTSEEETEHTGWSTDDSNDTLEWLDTN